MAYDATKSFLADLKLNTKKQKLLGMGAEQIEHLLAELETDAPRTWITATPTSTNYLQEIQGLGVVQSGYREGNISRPNTLRIVDGEIWVGSYGKNIARYDFDMSYLGPWRGVYGDPNSNPESYCYLSSFAVDETARIIVIAMSARDVVRAFNLDTGEFLWQVGTGSGGDISDGKLNDPTDVEFLPNGNLIIANYSGRGRTESLSGGSIVEIDTTDGSIIATRIDYNYKGEGAYDEVYKPVRARVETVDYGDGSQQYLFVSNYGKDHVAVFDMTTWAHKLSYYKPVGLTAQSLYPRGFCIDNGQLIVAVNGPKALTSLDLHTKNYCWHTGTPSYDDKTDAINRIGDFWDIWDVLPLGNGRYMVADYGNNRLSVVGTTKSQTIGYDVDIPEGYRAISVPSGFDVENSSYTIDVARDDLEAKDVILPLEKVPV